MKPKLFAAIMMAILAGVIIALVIDDVDEGGSVIVTPGSSQDSSPEVNKDSKTSSKKNVILGTDLVLVGDDVAPGKYRAVSRVSSSCYWKKSSDPEGSDIIDNDFPGSGRPQVTLKKGQWFKSSRCEDWKKI